MLLDFTQKDVEAYQKLKRGDINLVSFKRFVRFLRETGRMDWDEAEQLLDVFKHQ
ncbi:MAG: hypothetical protein LCI00_10035 [Chloroflexi bacterium]|nr:hypothetical protein [Chloroflexota bacterium]MCC6892934.1 hypothetical protein [Anaerolineae bacterium]